MILIFIVTMNFQIFQLEVFLHLTGIQSVTILKELLIELE